MDKDYCLWMVLHVMTRETYQLGVVPVSHEALEGYSSTSEGVKPFEVQLLELFLEAFLLHFGSMSFQALRRPSSTSEGVSEQVEIT